MKKNNIKIQPLNKSKDSFINKLQRILNKNLTFIFVPHSKKRSITINIRTYALFIIIITVSFITIFSIYTLTSRSVVLKRLDETQMEYEKRKNDLEIYQQSVSNIVSDLSQIQMFTNIISKSGVSKKGNNLFTAKEVSNEIETISNVIQEIDASKKYFTQITERAESRKKTYANVPNITPIDKNLVIAEIPYKRKNTKGIMIEALPSTLVRASANGEIVSVKYNAEKGYEITLKHAYDVTTIYRGMGSLSISPTEVKVEKGAALGSLQGNVFRKSYLEYEMKFASSYVDPDIILIN